MRLQHFKNLALKLENKPALSALSPSSLQLGALSDLAKLGDSGSSRTTQLYELMLEYCEKLFDNELEQHIFEDRLRRMFGLAVSIISLHRLLVQKLNISFCVGRLQAVHH